MTRFQKDLALVAGSVALVLAAVLFSVSLVHQPRGSSRPESAKTIEEQKTDWRAENMRSLTDLSAVDKWPSEEQARLDRARNDPEQMQQILLDLHQERITSWKSRLVGVQERRRRLGRDGRDAAQLVGLAADEREASSQIALYDTALSRITAWHPETFATFQATSAHAAANDVVADASSGSGSGGGIGPLPGSPNSPEAGTTQDGAGGGDSAQVQDAALAVAPTGYGKPSVSVFADGAAAASQPGPASPPAASATRPPEPAPTRPAESIPARSSGSAAARVPESGAARGPDLRTTLPAQPASFPPAAGPAASGETLNGVTAGVQQELRRWSTAMRSNDPRAEAAEYGPRLDHYFLRTNVDNAFVEADKKAYLDRGNVTADFTIRDVAVENATATSADVRLMKDVTYQRDGASAHQLIRSRLHLTKFGDGWKITGEQDFR